MSAPYEPEASAAAGEPRASAAADEPEVSAAADEPEVMADEARVVADAAAARAGVVLHDAEELDAERLQALARLFDRVWGRDVAAQGSIVSGEILWATSHAGAQVTAATADGELVGGTATFLGRDDDGTVLHSHLTGVLPEHAGRGVGWALKQHQRAWCLARGIERVVWTFDPLVRRNAVLNLVGLGALPVAYLEDLYGPMADERNAGLPTDRLYLHWDLTSPRARQAAGGRRAEPRREALLRTGAIESVRVGDDGEPRVAPAPIAERMLVQIPADIEDLRRTDPDTAARWPHALRVTMGAAMAGGHRVTGVTRDGWYALATAGGVADLAG